MNFAWLSPAAVLAGLAAIAGILFVLQRLRVRYREVEVVTTLFWRQAVEESRARVLFERFRHPWAYALIVAIASLLWLAAGGPKVAARDDRAHVLLLDRSGRNTAAGLASAAEALRQRAAELPRETTRVLVVGGRAELLLAPGEPLPLLERRLADIGPQASPDAIDSTLRALAETERPSGGLEIEIFGDAAPSAGCVKLLPSGISVRRNAPAEPAAGNAAITALGVSAPASGAWDCVDVIADARGELASGRGLELKLDGQPLNATLSNDARTLRAIARDVPARGGKVEVRLTGSDANALDDAAAIVVPERPRLRVAVSPSAPPCVRAALAADPGVSMVEGECDVAVRNAGESFATGSPALELVADGADVPAFRVEESGSTAGTPSERLERAFDDLGLAEIDSTGLATQAARPIIVEYAVGARRNLSMWASLTSDAFDFSQSRTFPLFLSKTMRWLADVSPLVPWVAAGEPLHPSGAAWTDASGARFDPLGAPASVACAGDFVDARGRPQVASLLRRDVDVPVVAAASAPLALADATTDLLPWLVLGALALLFMEWSLVRRERIP